MDNSRYWTTLGIVLAVIFTAAVGRWAVNHSGAQLKTATVYPAAEELDALARYLKPVPLSAVSAPEPEPMELSEDPFTARDFGPDELAEPSGPALPPRPRWAVSAILISEARKIAVINDAVVTIGATLSGGARVLEIQKDHVVIQESGGIRRVLTLLASR